MNKITQQIWIGPSSAAGNREALQREGIRYILNCAEDLPAQLGWKEGFVHFQCGMTDGANHPSLYRGALCILDAITHDPENKVLVHCHEGRSRSVYVVALHLVEKSKFTMSIQEAIQHIKIMGRDVKVADGHFKSFDGRID